MKSAKYLFPLAFVAVFSFTMCDYVTNPHDVDDIVVTTDTTKRNVIIEEWTGHTCIACPAAARLIDTLHTVYGERFMAISIHDGYFAEPCTWPAAPPFNHSTPNCGQSTPGAFNDNFMCATGADYSLVHPDGPGAPPQGMVNRIVRSGTEILGRGIWATLVDSLIDEQAAATLHVDHTYNSSNREIDVTVWGTWLQTYTGTINVAIMLTESGMVGWQTDGPTACDSEFVFKDVLRECLNTPGSIAGTQAFTGTAGTGTTYSYTLPAPYVLPAAYDAAQCHLIGLIYDTTTGEVLQCWEEKLQ